MSQVFFIGDLHLGHAKAINFREKFSTIEEHDTYICAQWESRITNKDLVYVLGDAAFTREGIERLGDLPGRKYLIRGNHDVFSSQRYLIHFEQIFGIVKYHGYWLSHAPVHPAELRGKINVHGHVHTNTVQINDYFYQGIDPRYWNFSAENINYTPTTLDEFKKMAVPLNVLPEHIGQTQTRNRAHVPQVVESGITP